MGSGKKVTVSKQTGDTKRTLGSFYTTGNPFTSEGFKNWLNEIPETATFVEPFAGSGNIIKLLQEIDPKRTNWVSYDIDETLPNVIHQNSLKNFPAGYDVTVTNPPYLSYHFAKRKKLEVNKEDFHGYTNLYMVAIAQALAHSSWAAFLIPETFLTANVFQERLNTVISLKTALFDDTEVPVCLALFNPEKSKDFTVWSDNTKIGLYSELAESIEPAPCAKKLKFNVLAGEIGLMGIDNTEKASIRFCEPEKIPAEKIKHSARLVSRIALPEEDKHLNTQDIIKEANKILNTWRGDTQDVLLTAFKGLRKDGMYRRRLDFVQARNILSQAVCTIANHKHNIEDTLF